MLGKPTHAGPHGRGSLLVAVCLALAVLQAACVKGPGEACQSHAECAPGLACELSKCRSCGDGASCLPIEVVVRACDADAQTLSRLSVLRFTITGDGLAPMQQVSLLADGATRIPAIPYGKNRRLEVEGFETTVGEEVLARGWSETFDTSAEVPERKVTVYLRPVGQFMRANLAASPSTCSQLAEGRGGHSATGLLDGRVLIAGGYRLDPSGNREFLRSLELFDPRTGETTVSRVTLAIKRSDHTAHRLPDGRVVIIGGLSDIDQRLSGVALAEIYDPATDTITVTPMTGQRVGHASAMLPNGLILVAGGREYPGDDAALATVEAFIPTASPGLEFVELPESEWLKQPRADHAAVAVGDSVIAFIGGTDGAKPLATTEAYNPSGGSFRRAQVELPPMAIGRSNPLATVLPNGPAIGILVTGPAVLAERSEDALDWLPVSLGITPPQKAVAAPPPIARAEACLGVYAGGAIVVGGKHPAKAQLYDTVDVFEMRPDGKLAATRLDATLPSPRTNAACTSLADGSVLVTGGQLERVGSVTVSRDVLVFQPR